MYYLYYLTMYYLSLPISAEIRVRRPFGADNVYTPGRAGFAGDAYYTRRLMKRHNMVALVWNVTDA